MNKILIIFNLFIATFSVKAQTPVHQAAVTIPAKHADTLQQLVQFMYKPAAESFAAFDLEKQFNLFSEKILLVVPNRSIIVDNEGYRNSWKRIADFHQSKGWQRQISFRISNKAWKGNHAFIEGVFRMTTQKPDGSERKDNYFIYKHTFELVNGKWLLTLDYHTSFDGKITKEEFEAASPLYE